MKSDIEKIEDLWKWFINSEQQIRDCIENESATERNYIIGQLDDLILALGMFTWEIGPEENKSWFFTISPNGDKELLKLSKKIMESAPDFNDWEFNYSKPAKIWDRKFQIYDNNMEPQNIDASGWKYVAHRNKDGMIELVLEAKNSIPFDDETASMAANIVVNNEIGEESRIWNISSIKIVDHIENKQDFPKFGLENLRKHLPDI